MREKLIDESCGRIIAITILFCGCSGNISPVEVADIHIHFQDTLHIDKGNQTNDTLDTFDTAGELGCIPKCGDIQCGDDGCGGSCGTCSGNTSCSDGICVEADCAGTKYVMSGVFANSVQDFTFDSVAVAIYHKKDIDPENDGCIARVDLAFRKGNGCLLEVRAEDAFDNQGRLRITQFIFTVDSQCPGFADAMEGTYEGIDNLDNTAVTLQDTEILIDNVDSWCYPSSLTVHLSGTIYSIAAGTQINVLPTDLMVSGSFLSIGDESLNCPCMATCAGKQCGGDGCNGSCGTCPDGFYCNAGMCKEGDCVPDCSNKECGSDGCAGSCGQCQAGYFCDQGICKEEGCIPQCM